MKILNLKNKISEFFSILEMTFLKIYELKSKLETHKHLNFAGLRIILHF